MGRIAGRFARVEPRRRAREFVLGLLSDLPRKNCWTLAEQAGHAQPGGMQQLLNRAVWDADGVRDDLRGLVVEHLAEPDAVLVVDETGDLKKGSATVGVQRQYTATAGRIENSQVAVYLAHAGRSAHALIDRELYLPRSWIGDEARCRAAAVPENTGFATKPQLAAAMVTRALDAGTPARWLTGDEVYGGDPHLRATLEQRQIGYVLAVSCHHRILTGPGRFRADVLATRIPRTAWQKMSAGDGAKGYRYYDWALLDLASDDHPGAASAAVPPKPAHRRTRLLPLLFTRTRAAARAGPGCRTALERGGVLPDQQGTNRAGQASGPPLALLETLGHTGDARPRLPHRHRGPRAHPACRRQPADTHYLP